MRKKVMSVLLALVLIISNFTGGGLIEHVHVEAADDEWVSIPEVNVSIVRNFWGSNDDLVVDTETGKITMKTGTMMGWKIPTGVYDGARFVISAIKGGTNEDGSTATFGGKICITGKDATGADYTDDNNQVKYLGDVDNETTFEFKFEEGAAATDVAIQKWSGGADSYVIVKEILLHKRPQPEFTPGKESLLIDKTVTFQRNEWGYYQRPLFDYCDTDLSKFIYAIQQPNAKVTIDFGVESAEWIQLLWKQVYSPEMTGPVTWCSPVSEINGAELYEKISNYAHTYDDAGNTTVFNDNTSYLVMHPAIAEDVTEMTVNIKVTADVPELEPEPEPTYKPELDKYVTVEACTNPRTERTQISVDTPIAGALSGLDECVKNALKVYPVGSYVKIVVESGKLKKLKFDNYGDFMGGYYPDGVEVKVEYGADYFCIGDTKENATAYYISYDAIRGSLEEAFGSDYDHFVKLYATGTGTVTWIGVVEKPAESDPAAPELVIDGPVDKAEGNHVFAIPGDKNIPVGDTVTIIFSYDAKDKFRIMLGNGGASDFDRSDAVYLEPGKVIDQVVELTAKAKGDLTDDIKYIHFRPENGGIPTVEISYDSIYIFYGTAEQYNAWKAKPENASFTTERERTIREHPVWETEDDIIEITADNCGDLLTVEDGAFVTQDPGENGNYAIIKLPRTIVKGQTISIHVIGTQPEDSVFRIWPSNSGNGEDVKGQTPKEIRSTAFSEELIYEVTDDGVNSLSIKGSTGNPVSAGVKITHIAVNYSELPELECDPNEKPVPLTAQNIVQGNGDASITYDENGITVKNTTELDQFGIGIDQIVVKCGDTYKVHIRGTASADFRIRINDFGPNTEIVDAWDTVTISPDGTFDGFLDLTIGDYEKIKALNGAEIKPVQILIKGASWGTPIPDSLTITHLGVVYPNAHEHNWGNYLEQWGTNTHSAECSECYARTIEEHIAGTEQGYNQVEGHWFKCEKCGARVESTVKPHEFDNYTANDDGTTHHGICKECPAEMNEPHTWDNGTVHPATETEVGYTLYTCTLCKAEKRVDLEHVHNGGEVWVADETSHWHKCTLAGCPDNGVYDKAAHTDDEGTVTKAATEAEEGIMTYKCTVCGRVTRTEAIPKLKHTHVEGEEWKSDEKTHWHECVSETCDDKTVRLSEAEHIDDEGTVTKPATEAEEGVMTYKCTVCGRVTRTEAIPKLKHTHVEGDEWKSDEKTHWHECVSETCDDKNVRLSEAEHIDDEGTVTKAATEAEEGVMTYKCTVCGRVTRTEAIPKLKHTHVEGDEWKSDEKTHWHECVSETCDDKSVRLSEAEHVWDDGKVTVEPTYTEEGEKLFTCEVCKATKTETIPVNAHDHETVMKSDENGHWYECTVCGEVIGEVEPHTPGEWITDTEATSTEAGKRHKECTACGYVTETLTVPATGNIDVEVPTVGNVPKVEIPAEQQEVLKDAVIDEEDVAAIENGASIDIALTVEDAEKTVEPEDKALIDAKTSEGEYRHVAYLDITLTKTVTDALGASTTEEISEISRPINIVIEVPYALSRTYRTFAVIRVHDGVAEVLSDLDSDPKTVTISTDLFSSYALVYTDGEHQQESVGGLIGHAHIITDIRHDSEYHWRGCFLCSIRVDYAPHTFVDGVCPICGYVDPDYVPSEEVEDAEVSIEAPAEGTDQTDDQSEEPAETPAEAPAPEAEVVETKEDETSENPKTGVIFTGIGAIMAAIAALIAKRK